MFGRESPRALFHAPLEVHVRCWLRTDFIDVKDAKMMNVELEYNLLGCPTTSAESTVCNHKLSIYVLHAEKELIGVELNPVRSDNVTYQKVQTIVPRVLPAPKTAKTYYYPLK